MRTVLRQRRCSSRMDLESGPSRRRCCGPIPWGAAHIQRFAHEFASHVRFDQHAHGSNARFVWMVALTDDGAHLVSFTQTSCCISPDVVVVGAMFSFPLHDL